MDLKNVDLLSLQTSAMREDPTTIALSNSLNPKLKEIAEEIKLCLIYSRIDELSVELLDELAWQMHVDFYSADLSIESKIQIIKNSRRWHKLKGTLAAVEEAANIVFGRAWIQEWFEYGGEPYMFKVNVEASNRGASPEDFTLLEKLINAYKNKRSWIEVINIFLTAQGTVYYGSSLTSGEELKVYPWTVNTIENKGVIEVAIANYSGQETISIYPKEG